MQTTTPNRKARREALRGTTPGIAATAPAAPTPSWTGETEEKAIFLPTGQYRKNGSPILRKVTIRYILLTKGYTAIRFTVTHITKYEGRGESKRPIFRSTTICDHREEATGHHGTTGAFGTREGQKPGRAKSYTPTSWVSEVTRFIGEPRAWDLLRESGWDGARRSL